MKPAFLTRRRTWLATLGLLLACSLQQAQSATGGVDKPTVNITEDTPSVEIEHRGIPITIKRISDVENRLVDDFTKTSRPCPPFCIHPMEAAPGVRTVGEIELLDFLRNDVHRGQGVLIDARMPEWYNAETIPGSVNIPFVVFSTPTPQRDEIFELLGARRKSAGKFDFSKAKRLCLFCNGPWCDQSPRAIRNLIEAGYPAEKLLYYRDGMQMWKLLGLTTVLPASQTVRND